MYIEDMCPRFIGHIGVKVAQGEVQVPGVWAAGVHEDLCLTALPAARCGGAQALQVSSTPAPWGAWLLCRLGGKGPPVLRSGLLLC